ncbi:MAG: arginine repressor [Planctomycetota bacterium]|nr:arginine repressor [Planctomycetota bacterium]
MHVVTHTQEARRAAILEILRSEVVTSQAALGTLLAGRKLGANQATLSRDLTALGVAKGPGGYTLPGPGGTSSDPSARLLSAARQYLESAVSAQNQVVLRTPPGGAAPLAAAIDGAADARVLGTIAGDDTILLVTRSSATASKVAAWLAEVAS